jgi:hypothetical protein
MPAFALRQPAPDDDATLGAQASTSPPGVSGARRE